jgi:hypothetical protein
MFVDLLKRLAREAENKSVPFPVLRALSGSSESTLVVGSVTYPDQYSPLNQGRN